MPPAHLSCDFSLEITSKDLPRLQDCAARLPSKTRVSITFLPGNDVLALAEVAAEVARLGFTPVPHISARRIASRRELLTFCDALARCNALEHAFVIGGDPIRAVGPYEDALAVITSGILADHGVREVGIGGYPESHPAISDPVLWQALADKTAALASQGLRCRIVTQFAFDAQAVGRWIRNVRARGIDAPISLGVAGPTSVQALIKFAARCGVAASGAVLSKYGISITRLLSTATPDRLIAAIDEQLSPAQGEVGLHLYPFGGIEKTAGWASTFFGRDASSRSAGRTTTAGAVA